VITEERVMELFAEDNPIPSIDDLDLAHPGSPAYLATLEQRSSEVTQLDTKAKDSKEKKKRNATAFLVAAAVVIVAGIGFMVSNNSDPADVAGTPASPDQVLTDYVEAFNTGDADAVMVFYAEDAVIEGHPEDTDGLATGKSEILPIEQRMQIHQGSNGRLEFTNMVVSGNTVTFDDIFINGDGDCFNSTGDKVTVEDDKITLYVFGELDAGLCPSLDNRT